MQRLISDKRTILTQISKKWIFTSSYTHASTLSKILVDLIYFASKFHTNVSMTSLALFTFWNDFNVDSKYSLERNYFML